MFSNFFNKVNQIYNEFLYGPFCSWVKDLFSGDDHMKINPEEFIDNQPTQIDWQERFKTCKENPLIFLSFIGYALNQFASYLPDENLRKELIEHYEEKTLPTFEGSAAEKMKEFIKCYKKEVEKPKGRIQNASIIAERDGQREFDLTGRFL